LDHRQRRLSRAREGHADLAPGAGASHDAANATARRARSAAFEAAQIKAIHRQRRRAARILHSMIRMNRLQVQREVREAIVVSDQLSRVAHLANEQAVSQKTASVRTTLDRLERQLGRRRVSPLFARQLDRVLSRLIAVCEEMTPDHQASAATLIAQAELLRMDIRTSSMLFASPGSEQTRRWVQLGVLFGAGALLFAGSFRSFARR
jgi:hypothetical protein